MFIVIGHVVYYTDCLSLKQHGNTEDGVYTITLSNTSVNVYCHRTCCLLYRLSIPEAAR